MEKSLKIFTAELLADNGVRQSYENLTPEYAVARAVIEARTRCGLTQAELAERMHTSQSFIARLENGATLPSMKTFLRVAEATGTRAGFELSPPIRQPSSLVSGN